MASLLRRDPLGDFGGMWGESVFVPNFDIRETNDGYTFTADMMPGLREEDVDISVTRNTLTVSGRRAAEDVQEGERYYCSERSFGEFRRSFSLPDGADPDSITAELRDGVLRINLKKQPGLQPKRIPLGQAKPAPKS